MSFGKRLRNNLPVVGKHGVWLVVLIGPYLYYWDTRAGILRVLFACFVPPLIGGVASAALDSIFRETSSTLEGRRSFVLYLSLMAGIFLLIQAALLTKDRPDHLGQFSVVFFGVLAFWGGTATGIENSKVKILVRRHQWLWLGGLATMAALAGLPKYGRYGLLSGLAVFCFGVIGIAWGASLPRWLSELSKLTIHLRRMGPLLGAFVVGYAAIVFVFAGLYAVTWRLDPKSLKLADRQSCTQAPAQDAKVGDFLYLSVVTAATLGYGDIFPCTPSARLIACVQVVFALGWTTIVVGIVSWIAQKESLFALSNPAPPDKQ